MTEQNPREGQIDLKQLMLIPVKNWAARKRLLFGVVFVLVAQAVYVLLGLTNFYFAPIAAIPMIFVAGYLSNIMRQVISNETLPDMPEWGTWNVLFRDGIKRVGLQFIIFAPLFSIFWNSHFSHIYLEILLFFLLIFLMFFTPFAETHLVARGKFSAAFRVNEWWPIFRQNIGGFIYAYVSTHGINMAISMGIFVLTTIPALIVSLIVMFIANAFARNYLWFFTTGSAAMIISLIYLATAPVWIMYTLIILNISIAHAYKDGQKNLAQTKISIQQVD